MRFARERWESFAKENGRPYVKKPWFCELLVIFVCQFGIGFIVGL